MGQGPIAGLCSGGEGAETLYEDAEPSSICHGPDDILEPVSKQRVGWVRQVRFENRAMDMSNEFHEVLQEVMGGHHLIESYWQFVYLIIPGIYSCTYKDGRKCSYFKKTISHLRELGLDCRLAKLQAHDAVATNAGKICELVSRIYQHSHKQVILIGHSKGGCDAVAAASRHWDELRGKVVGMVTLQSPLGGTPIADDLLDAELDGFPRKYMLHALDGQEHFLSDLTYERRMKELSEFPFPPDLPIVTFSSGTQRPSSPLAHLASYCRQEYNMPTDGITASWDADLPTSSIRVKFEQDWDHANCAFPEPHGPGDEAVNEACVLFLIRRIGLPTGSGHGHVAVVGKAPVVSMPSSNWQWQTGASAGGVPTMPARISVATGGRPLASNASVGTMGQARGTAFAH